MGLRTLSLFYYLFFSFSHLSPCTGADNSELAALLSFRSLIRSPDPAGGPLSTWNASVDYCAVKGDWAGVVCNDKRRVAYLELYSMGLSGTISPAVANLTSLEILNLNNNSLHGRIPAELGGLSLLTEVHLHVNSFDGVIPPELGRLSKLQVLGLGLNNLTGEIPPSIYNLSSLTILHLGQNHLSGTIRPDLGLAFPNLRILYVYENNLTGSIPPSLSNLTSMLNLQLCNNSFTGPVPPNLGAMYMLSKLDLGGNRLVARVPGDWAFLESLSNCTNLQYLGLRANDLGGALPAGSISNLSARLEFLSLQSNKISGGIPQVWSKFVNLTTLLMGDNRFTGPLPETIGDLRRLHELDLRNNMLHGAIPPSLGNLRELIILYLTGNNLTGSIPARLGNCQKLLLLDLSSNRLDGAIPPEVIGLSSLSILLNLSHNNLVGPLPSKVGKLVNLQSLDLSDNGLSGVIPASLGDCMVLQYLHLQDNSFQGEIPSTLNNLKGIVLMDLSGNNLSGSIPEFLTKLLSLRHLNLSFNKFHGEVPNAGVFSNSSEISVVGNDGLCGGISSLNLRDCSEGILENRHRRRRRPLSTNTVIIVVIVVSIVVAALVTVLFFIRKQQLVRVRSAKPSAPPDPLIPTLSQYDRVSYRDLFNATNGFSTKNLIGKGGFGLVYKGTVVIDQVKRDVAIKVLNLDARGASKSFLSECEALRSIRHSNLVKIITSCSSMDSSGNEFKALVFDFMGNGNLDMWLHPEGDKGPLRLSLAERLNVAVDVASGLDYLHHGGQIPIVHCDLKPSNVLLDDDMRARLGDFGLAKFIAGEGEKEAQNSTGSVWLKGSIGYIPPEYGIGRDVSTQGDVYSYGILLLELITGKRPIDDIFGSGLSLPKYVEMAFPEQVMTIVDSSLLSQETDAEAGEKLKLCVTSAIRIGLSCSKEVPRDRMKMRDVVNEILFLRDTYLKSEVQIDKNRENQIVVQVA